MGLFGLFGNKKKANKLSFEEEQYAKEVDWDNIFIEYFVPNSLEEMLQRLAIIYKKNNGDVDNNQDFINLQTKLNEVRKEILVEDAINFKLLFDKYLADVDLVEFDEEDKIMSFEEAIAFIDKFAVEQTKEQQKELVTKQAKVAEKHRCSVHNKPIEYGFSLDGLNLCISVLDKCCDQSMKELVSKLK